MGMIKIVDMADEVWRDLGTPPDNQIPYIATWFRSNVGKLNILIATDYVVDKINQEIIDRGFLNWLWQKQQQNPPPSGCWSPNNKCYGNYFRNDEADLYKELFKVRFYEKKVNDLLYAGQYQGVIEVEEGDSHVRRISKNDLAKSWSVMKKEANDRLIYLTHLYKYYKSAPVQVTGDDFVTPAPYSAVGDYGPGFYY